MSGAAVTIVGARLLPDDAAAVAGGTVGLRAADGVVVALGPEVTPEPGDTVVDAAGGFLAPGLVNGHTHAAMTLFRGWGDDLPLMEWLESRIWPAEARLTDDDVYWGTRWAILEMLRTGTVCFWDMYWHGAAVARAVADSGIRAAVSSVVIDGGDPVRGRALRGEVEDRLDAIGAAGDRVTASLGPHAVYTVAPETIGWLAELGRDRGTPIQIHLAETEEEVRECRERHGVGPAALLDRCGALGPDTILAHGVWFDDAELDLVAERGATIVTNPVSNLKLAVGAVFRYDAARRLGIPVGLGTDGAGSNNSLDLLADAKFLSLAQKHASRDPAAMPAREAWAVATGVRAPRLGTVGPVGTAAGAAAAGPAVGSRADVVVLRDPDVLAPGDPVHNLVYAASGHVVDTVVVDGRVLVRDGAVIDHGGPDPGEIRARAGECARRLGVG